MATAVQPFTGVYELDRNHSTVQFAVRHVQVSMFRASFADIDAQLVAQDDAIALEGRALVESISIVEPADFRDHVVRSADFFDADAHPAITFRSTSVQLGDDGSASVSGELTIRGVSRSVTAHGTYRLPRKDPFGAYRAGVELAATVDRRGWEMNWQLPLPDGSDALGWDVEITAQLELVKKTDAPARDQRKPPPRVVQQRASRRGRRGLPFECRLRRLARARRHPRLQRGSRHGPAGGCGSPTRDRTIGRRSHRHARVQRFGPAVWAQAELRKVLAAIGARVDDRELPVSRAREAFTAEMRLRDPHLAARLRAIVSDLMHRTASRAA